MGIFHILLEVMDKVPSVQGIWLFFLACGAVGFALARRWGIWSLVLSLPAMAFIAWPLWEELHYSDVAHCIEAEAGSAYYLQTYAAMGTGLALPLLGCVYKSVKKSI